MKRFLYLTTALAATLALSASAAQATGFDDALSVNGPALDGRRPGVPGGSGIIGAPTAEEVRFDDEGIQLNGPALDGRRVATPDLVRLAIQQLPLPGDTRRTVLPDRGWQSSDQDQRIQQ